MCPDRISIDLGSLQALAEAVGLELTLKPRPDTPPMPATDQRSTGQRSPLADPKWGLAWWRQVAPTLPSRARQEVERKLHNIEQGLNDAES